MRVLTVLNGDQPLQNHNSAQHLLFHPYFQFGSDREADNVGDHKTIDGGNECNSVPPPSLEVSERLPMTWISPRTAPIIPMVGEYPPAAS